MTGMARKGVWGSRIDRKCLVFLFTSTGVFLRGDGGALDAFGGEEERDRRGAGSSSSARGRRRAKLHEFTELVIEQARVLSL